MCRLLCASRLPAYDFHTTISKHRLKIGTVKGGDFRIRTKTALLLSSCLPLASTAHESSRSACEFNMDLPVAPRTSNSYLYKSIINAFL